MPLVTRQKCLREEWGVCLDGGLDRPDEGAQALGRRLLVHGLEALQERGHLVGGRDDQ